MSEAPVPNIDEAGDPAWSRRGTIAWCAFFAALAYVAHFWRFKDFGLYEDDYITVPNALRNTPTELWEYIRYQWGDYIHGRPVGWSIWRVIPWLGFRVGNLGTVYLLSGAIVATNCVLFYLLLRRCWGEVLAILGGLAFTLCPADSCRQILVHANILQPALMFCLIAAHACLSRRWWVRWIVPYVFCALILLTYETLFLPLLLAPLLRPKWDRRLLIGWVIHVTICVALLGTALTVRKALGEARLAGAEMTVPVPERVVRAIWHGPTVSMPLWYNRAYYTLAGQKKSVGVIVLGFFALAGVLLASPVARSSTGPRLESWRRLGHPLLMGVALLYLGYAFAITPEHYLQEAVAGRMTSEHLAANLGGSIVMAVAATAILLASERVRFLRPTMTVGAAAYFAVLIGFAFIVQKGFVDAASAHRTLWTRVLKLCPDLSRGTQVLMEGAMVQNNDYVMVSSWADPLVLPLICQFSDIRREQAMLVLIDSRRPWEVQFERKGEQVLWREWQPGNIGYLPGSQLPPGNTILLRWVNDRLQRVDGEIDVLGAKFQLKPMPHQLPPDYKPAYTPGPAYRLLIRDSGLPPAQRFETISGPVLQR